MKKVILVIVFALVSVLAKAESIDCTTNDVPVRETIGTVR